MVRDALLHLYDPPYLQTHALARRLKAGSLGDPALSSGRLFQVLVGAIEALRPAPGTPTDSRAWRTYRLLELRYVEGHSAESTIGELAISSTQYKRDNLRALEAVTSVLQERFLGDEPAAGPLRSREALAFAEAEEVASHTSAGQIDLNDALAELVELVRPETERAGSTLRLETPSRVEPIRADRVILRQALLGLIGTALSEATGGEVEVVVTSARQEVAVAIRAVSGPKCTGSSRMGDGELEVARRLVDLLGGRLEIREPAVGEWTATLRLPVSPRFLVLVVDNDEDFVGLVARFLAAEGAEVIGAPDVRIAEAMALEQLPSVILLDVMLPGRDGWDGLLALRSHPETREIPVVVCSVLYEPQVARALGVAGYLAKPISRDELLAALRPFRPAVVLRESAG